jgi:hypothetical protein
MNKNNRTISNFKKNYWNTNKSITMDKIYTKNLFKENKAIWKTRI